MAFSAAATLITSSLPVCQQSVRQSATAQASGMRCGSASGSFSSRMAERCQMFDCLVLTSKNMRYMRWPTLTSETMIDSYFTTCFADLGPLNCRI